jgi:PAS domain S-box-containing protein
MPVKGQSLKRHQALVRKYRELRLRLAEAEETLRAIREGEVDAVVVSGARGEQIFSLVGADSIYRLIVETMKEAAFTVSFDGVVLFCNSRFGDFVAKPMEQIIGRPLQEFVAEPESVPGILALARKESVRQRLVFRSADGKAAPAHISTNILNQADGMSICVVANDLRELENSTELIQQLRQALEEAEEGRQLLQVIMENVQDGIAIIDAQEMKLRMISQYGREIYGGTGDSLNIQEVLNNWKVFEPDGVTPMSLEALPIVRALKNGEIVQNCEMVQDNGAGRRLTILCSAAPIRAGSGEIAGGIIAWRDISARKLIEDQLKTSRDELEWRVQERTKELIHTVETLHEEVSDRILTEQSLKSRSEQLRRLTAELNFTEQREKQRLAQILHDGLQQILVGAKYRLALAARSQDLHQDLSQVSELIDDAIETSRSLTAELSPPILLQGDLLSALEWLARWMQAKHGLDVGLVARDKISPMSESLLILFFQAARELLFNVVKHSGVRTARIEIKQMDGNISMNVADNGAGFDVARLKTEIGPTEGIGLFGISERLSYLGGHMQIDSAIGRGSRFTLTAPISTTFEEFGSQHVERNSAVSVAISPERVAQADQKEKKIRIMLVDDHLVMRQGLAGLLRGEADFEIVGEASDGKSAVALARRIRPDVILMDISMPIMDGIQATRKIHKDFPHICIIGLSMFQENEQESAMREAGAVQYLAKTGPSELVIESIRACRKIGIAAASGTAFRA